MPSKRNTKKRMVPPRAVNRSTEETVARRRRFQRGQLLELESGWATRYYEHSIVDGVRKRHRVQVFLGTREELTKPQAKRAMQNALSAVNDVSYRPTTTTTFREYAKQWITDCEKRNQRPNKRSTLANRRSILDRHVLPVLGDIPLTIAKLVKASVVDEQGNQLYVTKWNHRFIDCPTIDRAKQNRPTFTSAEVTAITKAATGRIQMACILLAASGLRAGELIGLEIRHFDGSAIQIQQSVWGSKVQPPKTQHAFRFVDLHPDVASLLKQFVGERTTGFIFETSNGRPLSQTNLLCYELHPLLEELKIGKRGFHSFRRFRNTFLRQSHCPDGLLKFWMGHSMKKDMSDVYDRSSEDVQYRKDVSAAMGTGFDVPRTLTAKRPKPEKLGLTGRQAELTYCSA
jgi:integrase